MIQIYRVRRTKNFPIAVEIKVGRVILQFIRKENKIELESKYILGSRVLDPVQLYVPKELFTQALQRATGILFPRKKSSRQLPLF
jgi:hypothetical protein